MRRVAYFYPDVVQTALTMSRDMGYHWGVVDAEDVLNQIKG